ncbi:MAG: hypothetical protein ACLQMF_07025 [Rectinemataceae bacterium]
MVSAAGKAESSEIDRYPNLFWSIVSEVDVAFPVVASLVGDPRIVSDSLPAGRYATALFVEHPEEPDMSTWKTELAFLTAETPDPMAFS